MGACFVDLDTFLKESDFVIVTCALTPETRGVFTADKFALMKKSAIFVNTSRGGLYSALFPWNFDEFQINNYN